MAFRLPNYVKGGREGAELASYRWHGIHRVSSGRRRLGYMCTVCIVCLLCGVFLKAIYGTPPHEPLQSGPLIGLDCKAHLLKRNNLPMFVGKHVGEAETRLIKLIAANCERTHPVVVDVGANIGGFMKIICAQWPGAHIHVFEPGEEMMHWLRKVAGTHCGGSHNVWFNQRAVGDKDGVKVTLYGPQKQRKYSTASLKPHNTGASISPGVNKARRSTTVLGTTETVRLDAFFDQHLEFVKVDAEGYDPMVLFGLEAKLQSNTVQLIYWEYGKHWKLASNFTYSYVVEWLYRKGYHSYIVGKSAMVPISGDCHSPTVLDNELDYTQNILSIWHQSVYMSIPSIWNKKLDHV